MKPVTHDFDPIEERHKGMRGEPNYYGDTPDDYVLVNRNAVKWILTRAKFPTDTFSETDCATVELLTVEIAPPTERS